MSYTPEDKRRVYLACRAIFVGEKAQLRQQSKVLKTVKSHQSSLQSLERDLGVQKIVDIAKQLLEKSIFESELKAKMEFPELFRTTSAQHILHAASENDAARSEAAALIEIEKSGGKPQQVNKIVAAGQPGGKASAELTAAVGDLSAKTPPAGLEGQLFLKAPGEVAAGLEGKVNGVDLSELQAAGKTLRVVEADPSKLTGVKSLAIPPLYPCYFPFKSQHTILTTAQHLLEECCFDFGRKIFPTILEDHGWDCAEAVELSIWTRILADASHLLSLHALEARGILLKDILSSACNLRNTAVHRLPTTARGISQFIQSALRLAETLQDHHRAAQLEELHHNIDNRIKAMELNKNVLEDTLNNQLQEIQRRREELDSKEKELIAAVLRDDHENQSLIGSSLEESVRKIFEHRLEAANDLENTQGSPEAKEDEEITNGDVGVFDNDADVEKAVLTEKLE